MTVPAIVHERAGEEEVVARVPLGGDDVLFVTPARTLVYRAEGLLSGESVEEYPHDAERVEVEEGRRKVTISLDHGVDGASQFTVPADRFEHAIEPILTGVFAAAEITEAGESVDDVYRLGELTLVITDARVVKHVGNALWDEEFEEYPFADVTGIDVEEGSVSSQVIVEVDGRPQRVKIPSDDARRIRTRIEEAVLAYHDAGSYEAFRQQVQAELEEAAEPEAEPDEASVSGPEFVEESPATETEASTTDGEADVDVIETSGGEPAEADAAEAGAEDEGGEGMVFGSELGQLSVDREAEGEHDLVDELTSLRQAVERQNDLLRRHQRAIERLSRQLDEDDE